MKKPALHHLQYNMSAAEDSNMHSKLLISLHGFLPLQLPMPGDFLSDSD